MLRIMDYLTFLISLSKFSPNNIIILILFYNLRDINKLQFRKARVNSKFLLAISY